MGLFAVFILAAALSMDAFAVAVCAGVTMKKFALKKALVIGLYFGLFQALMPLIGYLVAAQFANAISAIDHWVAFVLLGFIGGKMVYGAVWKADEGECTCGCGGACVGEFSVRPSYIVPLAFATSIDALAAGVSFALVDIHIAPAAMLIGVITFSLSTIGVKIGSVFGAKFKTKAELAGGVVLILMGLWILFDHFVM